MPARLHLFGVAEADGPIAEPGAGRERLQCRTAVLTPAIERPRSRIAALALPEGAMP